MADTEKAIYMLDPKGMMDASSRVSNCFPKPLTFDS
jgi:hypothetical protein